MPRTRELTIGARQPAPAEDAENEPRTLTAAPFRPRTHDLGREAIGFDAFGARHATIGVFVLLLLFALAEARYFFAPLISAIVFGFLLSPVASRMERRGIPGSLVALILLAAALLAIAGAVFGLIRPLSNWVDRAPLLWFELRQMVRSLEEPLRDVSNVREQMRSLVGSDKAIVVSEQGAGEMQVITGAPLLAGQFLIFVGAFYFYLAGRRDLKAGIVGLYKRRGDQLRVARLFGAMEDSIAHYLAAISTINLCFGIIVGLVMWLAGLPEPALIGTLAFALNFVPYIGPAIMTLIIFAIGLLSYTDVVSPIYVTAAYVFLNMLEGQFVTPMVIGRAETLNPFLVFCCFAFGLWFWGAIGAFLAMPLLLVGRTIAEHSRPGRVRVLSDGASRAPPIGLQTRSAGAPGAGTPNARATSES